jgi:glutamate-1-semialdehyde 2,1-aminomutase
MLDKGVRLLSRGLWYLSAAHTKEDVQIALETAASVMKDELSR